MNRSARALGLLTAWIAALLILGWQVQQRLVIGSDLRLFLPSPVSSEQRLLLQEIGESPASRLLVIALGGAPAEVLADASRSLAQRLQASGQFRFVTNGEYSLDAVPQALLPYRFVLSRTLDSERFDKGYLQAQLHQRARDLASPAGVLLEAWLPRDPTLEMLKLVQLWQPMHEPRREFDVWFDRAGGRALLLAQTHAAAFDPRHQRQALDALQRAFGELAAARRINMAVSGAGKFSVLMEQRTRSEARALGSAATIGMIVLLLISYRRISAVVLSALPLASAGLVGLAAVTALFGTVHGITLACGFTLIGVAQDYPLHLLSHQCAGRSPAATARELWPTLATGIASTCIAYLTFLFSGVVGLAQLACFTVAGLAAAGLATRFGLPPLMAEAPDNEGQWPFLDRLWRRAAALPWRPAVTASLAGLAALAIAAPPQPFWENDLSRLTALPQDLLLEDQQLRAEFGAPDMRYLLVIRAGNTEQALHRLESLEPALQDLRARGAISGYDHAARYIPAVSTQRKRHDRLPDAQDLRSALDAALVSTPFRPGAFEPFIREVDQARALPPLTPGQLRDSPLGLSLEALLRERADHAIALVTFSGVRERAALAALATKSPGEITLLDLKEASQTLIAAQRARILWCLAGAVVLLFAVIRYSLGNSRRVLRVLAPVALTTLLVLALLRVSGASLNLFHLIALILTAGLGLDYALFFEHAAGEAPKQRRTLHAILVCALSTLMVFALLATSNLPILRAIGVTVTLGVMFNFLFALLLTRPSHLPHVTG